MSVSSISGMAVSTFLSSAVCACIVLTMLVRVPSRATPSGQMDPQHIHKGTTSRVGGLAVFLGVAAAIAAASGSDLMSLQVAGPLLLASLPVLAVGLWEDVSRSTSPGQRLLAAFVSAALASMNAQGVISRLDLPVIDGWLAFLPFAVLLTWFMVAGACNAFNIIDGTNGLAGGSALLAFLGLAVVALHVRDAQVLAQSAALAGALVGFLLWNYPKGTIFLGDGGAYFIGFMYAQLAIRLVTDNAGVSAWFVIALAAYPIFETLFSIYRRKIVRSAAAMQPDVQHLHSLLYTHFLNTGDRPPTVERRAILTDVQFYGTERRQPQRRANARVAPRLWLHGVLCLAFATLYYDNTSALMAFAPLYALVYTLNYRIAERLNLGPPPGIRPGIRPRSE